MLIEGLDDSSLNSELGLSTSTTVDIDTADQRSVRINQDDQRQFAGLADQQPTGVNLPAVTAPANVPDYLAPYIVAPAEPTTPPVAVDWQSRYTQAFGADAPALEAYDQDSFEREAVRRSVYDNTLAGNPEVPQLRGIIDGSIPDLKVVQDSVRGRLAAAGFESDSMYQAEIAAYVDGGALTDKGLKMLDTLRQNATQKIGQIEQQATQAAQQAEGRLSEYNGAVDTLSKTFKPFGLDLPETQLADMAASIRSGQVDQWLDTHTTAQEAAEKQFWLAIISNPVWRGEMARLLDGRGFSHGSNRRTASQLK